MLASGTLFSQRALKLTVEIDGETRYAEYKTHKENTYVSAKDLANALKGTYYYAKETGKIEIKFTGYKVKFTGLNQFVILLDRDSNEKGIYQLPLSTFISRGDVFIPAKYSMPYIEAAFGRKINFNDGNKNISVMNDTAGTEMLAGQSEPPKPPVVSDVYTPEETDNGGGTNIKKPEADRKPRANNTGYNIFDISVEEKSNGTLIRISADKKLPRPGGTIKEGTLYLFLSGATVLPEIENKFNPGGVVKSFNYRSVSGNPQFEFEVKYGTEQFDVFQDPETFELMVSIHNNKLTGNETVKNDIEKWEFDVIVIDAGHGGKDPGAVGYGGVKEKDINLALALKLGKLIELNMPKVKVIYTRKDDRFIELYKRGKIANENNGKLFISIHCNSLPKKYKNTRGFEVYLLRPGRTEEAIAIAEIENSVIKLEDNPDRYKQLTDENFILVSMAHSSYMRYSEHFADLLHQGWERNVAIPSRGVKQAGFYVLVGASMPSVLVEAGFLTNKTDVDYLLSSNGQDEIARTMFNTIRAFRTYYDKAIEEAD